MVTNNWTVEEITIPYPHGFISARAWGSKSGHPVLALHGWLDNAGTFDTLIPLLTPSLYIVAVDGLGHGFSSHKPRGSHYNMVEYLADIKRVVTHLNWEKFSIIGHSMGGALALLYASVFPESVLNVVSLDLIKAFSRPCDKLPKYTRKVVENLLSSELKLNSPAPVYTPIQAKERLIKGVFNEITSESADILLKRGIKKSDCGTGVVFTRDIRLRLFDFRSIFSHESLKAYMDKLRCNLLILSTPDSMYKTSSPEVIPEFLTLYEKSCSSFTHVEVNGTHFVHLNDPQTIATHVNSFFHTHLGDVRSKL